MESRGNLSVSELCAKALKLIKSKKHATKGYGKAFKLLTQALELNPKSEAALEGMVQFHMMFKKPRDIEIALDRLREVNPSNAIYVNVSRMISAKLSASNNLYRLIASDDSYDLISYNQFHFATEYLQAFDELKKKHVLAHKQDFPKQIDWALECLAFIFKYFDNTNGDYGFVDPAFSNLDKESKFKKYENELIRELERKRTKIKSGQMAKFYDDELNRIVVETTDEIFYCDIKIVLRQLFETVHQFSREERAKFGELMPWSVNSWYYLEFIGSLFATVDRTTPYGFGFAYNAALDSNVKTKLYEFHYAVANYLTLVRELIPDLVKIDLKKLQGFFTSIKTYLDTKDLSNVISLNEVPNFKVLLWHFKDTFNLFRLLTVLPSKGDLALLVDRPMRISATTQFTTRMNHSWPSTLTSRLALLRTLLLSGDYFAHRNLGHYLSGISDIDPEIPLHIRNGLIHFESLSSTALIEALEQDENDIAALINEQSRVKDMLSVYAANEYKKLAGMPVIRKSGVDRTAVVAHLESIKAEFRKHENSEQVSIDEELLPRRDIDYILSEIDPQEQAIKNEIREMLNRRAAFDITKFYKDELNTYSGKMETSYYPYLRAVANQKDKRARNKQIGTLYHQAELVYKSSVKEVKADLKTKKDIAKDEVSSLRIKNTDKYFPTMKLLCLRLRDEIDSNNDSPTPSMLVKRLKGRITLLVEVLRENDFITSEYAIDVNHLTGALSGNMEQLSAVTYAVIHILSLMNKLASIDLLQKIHGDLILRLPDFIALRNVLSHSDCILESRNIDLIQMTSQVPKSVAYFVCELVANYFNAIMKFELSPLAVISPSKGRIKQDKPLSISGSFGERFFGSTATKLPEPPKSPESPRLTAATMSSSFFPPGTSSSSLPPTSNAFQKKPSQ